MKSFLNRKVRLAFGFAMLTLFLMGSMSYRWMLISDESGQSVKHTHIVIESIQDLSLTMKSIESASRGFVLSGKESDLNAYRSNVLRAEQDQATIRSLTADNPAQQNHFPAVETLAAERIEHADTIIGVRRNEGLDAAIAAVGRGPVDQVNDEFQSVVDKMQAEELRSLALRTAATDHDRNQTQLILIVGTLLGILIAGLAAWSAIRDSTKRATAEEALQQREETYRMLLDGVQDYAIFMLDPRGAVVSWSASAAHIKGYTAQEIIGHSFSRFFTPEDVRRGRPEEVLRLAATNGRHEEFGMRVRKDQTLFLASVTFIALRDAAGNLRGFSEICRDLSEHKESEVRYRGLLEAAPDGMVVVNQAGEIVLLNAQAEKQFGYRRDELLGQKVTNIIPTGFAERMIADGTRTATEALAQQIGTGIELNGKRKDGSEFPIEIMLSPLESADGILITAAIRDITVRKDAEKHLAQMEGKYRGLMEAAPDGMVVVNKDGEIVLLNARAEKQFGYRRDELLGQRVKSIIPEGFAERLIADALRTTAEALAQQIDTGIELHGRRKDGTAFPLEIMLSPLESPEGILVTAAIRDISERKLLERQLHQSQKMEAIGQLTGGIAHDFNNLLGVIIGNLDLLDRLVTDNPAAIKRVRTAQKAATRGADITRRLLVFSSNEELKPSVVLLGDSIQNMIELATHGLGADIKITTRIDGSMPPLFVDSAGLESALLNLVVNARDAMPNGGSIIITSHEQHLDESYPAVRAGDLKPGRYVRIAVTDTGNGMSRETLERAFEPFFTTKSRDKGTGLGLAMVYGFVKQSGGTVRVYSELDHGTTVSFYLPLAGNLPHPVPLDTPKPLNTEFGCAVLVVDDEEDLLEIATSYLAEMGFTSFQAGDGASAIEILKHHAEIDLLFTDIVMPGEMNGVELVQKARVLRPNLKIIYSSGFPAEALAERSMSLVDGPLLHKPYQRNEFTAMIHHVMDSNYAAAAT
jgi:PAS domain S-box-containing protein